MRQPLSEVAIFRDVVIDHEGIHTGFAHHQRFLNFSVVIEPQKTMLVSVELANEALIQGIAHEPTEVDNAKPSLRVQYQCMDKTIVTREPRWFEMLVHFELSTSGDDTAP